MSPRPEVARTSESLRVDNSYEVIKGLLSGERIVTGSSFLIDSESNLKAALAWMGGMRGRMYGSPRICLEYHQTHQNFFHESDDLSLLQNSSCFVLIFTFFGFSDLRCAMIESLLS